MPDKRCTALLPARLKASMHGRPPQGRRESIYQTAYHPTSDGISSHITHRLILHQTAEYLHLKALYNLLKSLIGDILKALIWYIKGFNMAYKRL